MAAPMTVGSVQRTDSEPAVYCWKSRSAAIFAARFALRRQVEKRRIRI